MTPNQTFLIYRSLNVTLKLNNDAGGQQQPSDTGSDFVACYEEENLVGSSAVCQADVLMHSICGM